MKTGVCFILAAAVLLVGAFEVPEVSAFGSSFGPQRWAFVLCRFADIPDTHFPPDELEDLVMAPGGVREYIEEASYGNMQIEEIVVKGWYDLPHERFYYVPRDLNGRGDGEVQFQKLAEDCTNAAGWDFSEFSVINLVFNAELDGAAHGGALFLVQDGVGQWYGATWLKSFCCSPTLCCSLPTILHEGGHALGLDHTFDSNSKWDPMGLGLDDHYIAHHKDKLGWITPERKYVHVLGSKQTIRLARLALPSVKGYLMGVIPVGPNEFYTLELRRRKGYDMRIPMEGVVLHYVNLEQDREGFDATAQVVVKNGGRNPNGPDAVWRKGESFVTSNGVTVSVVKEDKTGFTVKIE